MNQAPVKFSVSSLETGQEVIEIMSSDAEDIPQPPYSPPTQTPSLPDISQMPLRRLRQSNHGGGSPDLPDLTPIPPQSSFPLSPQLPEVSSSHGAENMMDIDDPIQHSPPPPSPPLPQVDLTVDAIERTLSNVTVTSSPAHQAHSLYAFGSVEDSEPEAGPSTEMTHNRDALQATPTPPVENTITQAAESDDDFHSPPSTSPSSHSHHTSLSRHPTPTVRGLLYSGPSGIFKDANNSLMQHTWITLAQNTAPSPPTLSPNVYPDGEPEVRPPPATDATTPIPDPLPDPAVSEVNHTILLSITGT